MNIKITHLNLSFKVCPSVRRPSFYFISPRSNRPHTHSLNLHVPASWSGNPFQVFLILIKMRASFNSSSIHAYMYVCCYMNVTYNSIIRITALDWCWIINSIQILMPPPRSAPSPTPPPPPTPLSCSLCQPPTHPPHLPSHPLLQPRSINLMPIWYQARPEAVIGRTSANRRRWFLRPGFDRIWLEWSRIKMAG